MLKSRQIFPPSGFEVYVAETGWKSPIGLGFRDTVFAVMDHRKANARFNLPTDEESVSAWVDQFTEARLRSTYGAAADQWLIGASDGSPPPPFLSPPRRRPRVGVGAAEEVRAGKATVAIGLVLDFLGPSLKPVPHALAEKRASVCVTCENNLPGGTLAHIAGEGLKALLEYKAEEKLTTSHDAKLFECRCCMCNLHLKPHVELGYILEQTTPEVMEKLPPHCWIKTKDA